MSEQKQSLYTGMSMVLLCAVMALVARQPAAAVSGAQATITPDAWLELAAPQATPYVEQTQWPEDTVPTPALWTPAPTSAQPITIRLYNHVTGEITPMDMETYLVGVLAAEMGDVPELAALEAQAVAARTLAFSLLRSQGGSGAPGVPDADISSDYRVGQAWISEKTMRAKFGDGYDRCVQTLRQAIENTRGVILSYQGAPILAMYYASAGGQSETAVAVLGRAYDYLVSVQSPGEEAYAGYSDTVTISADAFLRTLEDAGISCGLDAQNLPGGVAVQSRTSSGRVETLRVGTQFLSGLQTRTLFGLKSANFTVAFGGGLVTFATLGFGHGVGLSQAGARAMAAGGAPYAQILAHYYPGAELAPLDAFLLK